MTLMIGDGITVIDIYVTELDCLTVQHLVNGGRNSVTGSKGAKTKL